MVRFDSFAVCEYLRFVSFSGLLFAFAWLHAPLNAILMALLLITLFWHTALGLGVVIKDYVHEAYAQTVALILMLGTCLALAITGVGALIGVMINH